MTSLCVRCGRPLNGTGSCDSCAGELTFVERELQRLRDEIARDEEARDHLPASVQAETAGAKVASAGPIRPASSDVTVDGAGSAPPPETVPGTGPSPAKRRKARDVPEPDRPASPWTSGGAMEAGLRARELDVTTPEGAREALEEVLSHRRRGRGRIIGLAGLPRHGKTKLADRIRERAVQRPGVDLRYDKTSRGRVNIYYVPGREEHHVLIDVAGEDFQLLGDYSRELPALMSEFLWPVLQRLDGLLLLLALPIVWSGFNRPGVDHPQDPDPAVRKEMRQATAAMIDAHRTLLKYAIVARRIGRLGRLAKRFGIRPDQAPSRSQIDDVYQAVPDLPYPVLVAFSKADLFAPGETRSGLYSPAMPGLEGASPPPLHPLRTDPLVLGRVHFPELYDFLEARVRHFKFDFIQALEDVTEQPDPQEARVPDAPIETLVGADSALAFLTAHPWRFPGISTRTALRLDRWLRRGRWNGGTLQSLAGTDPVDAL